MDAALQRLQSARTDADKTAAYAEISKVLGQDAASLPYDSVREYVLWQSKVHGVQTTARTVVLFDKAWVAR